MSEHSRTSLKEGGEGKEGEWRGRVRAQPDNNEGGVGGGSK